MCNCSYQNYRMGALMDDKLLFSYIVQLLPHKLKSVGIGKYSVWLQHIGYEKLLCGTIVVKYLL